MNRKIPSAPWGKRPLRYVGGRQADRGNFGGAHRRKSHGLDVVDRERPISRRRRERFSSSRTSRNTRTGSTDSFRRWSLPERSKALAPSCSEIFSNARTASARVLASMPKRGLSDPAVRKPSPKQLKPMRKKLNEQKVIPEIFSEVGARHGFPVFAGLPVGHGPGHYSLPIGARYQLRPRANSRSSPGTGSGNSHGRKSLSRSNRRTRQMGGKRDQLWARFWPKVDEEKNEEVKMANIFDSEFVEVNVNILRRISGKLPFDVFIRRGENTYTKLFLKGDEIDRERLRTYETGKGVEEFYVQNDDYRQYLLYVEQVANTLFEKRNADAGEVVAVIKEMTNLAMLELVIKKHVDSKSVGYAMTTVKGCIDVLANDPKSLFKVFKLLTHHPYSIKHALMTSVFALLLAKVEKLESEKTLTTLGLGALLHDVGMSLLTFDPEEENDLDPGSAKGNSRTSGGRQTAARLPSRP